MSNSFIVDASVVVGLFVNVSHTNACIEFFDRLMDPDALFIAPDAMYFEVASSLRKLERRGLFDDLDQALVQVAGFEILSTSSRDLMQAAVTISREHVMSPYDSFYLALSQREGLPLVTADDRLVNGVKGKGYDVRSVAQL